MTGRRKLFFLLFWAVPYYGAVDHTHEMAHGIASGSEIAPALEAADSSVPLLSAACASLLLAGSSLAAPLVCLGPPLPVRLARPKLSSLARSHWPGSVEFEMDALRVCLAPQRMKKQRADGSRCAAVRHWPHAAASRASSRCAAARH